MAVPFFLDQKKKQFIMEINPDLEALPEVSLDVSCGKDICGDDDDDNDDDDDSVCVCIRICGMYPYIH